MKSPLQAQTETLWLSLSLARSGRAEGLMALKTLIRHGRSIRLRRIARNHAARLCDRR